MVKQALKQALQMTGVYPLARSVYRHFNGEARAWKRAEQALCSRFINPGDLVFDIGVNVGQKSEVFLGLGARVVGLEPNPLCEPVLKHAFGRNPNFTLVQKAVGDKPGEAMLNFVGTEATASLRDDWIYLGYHGGSIQQAPTPVTTLDELIAEFGVPAFCKIDVEGFEPQVIAGLSRPLPLLTFEYNLRDKGYLETCLSHLAKLGSVEVNENSFEGADLQHDSWLAVDEFLAVQGRPERGDCWVRTAVGN